MNKLESASFQAINNCLQVKNGERVVIITDKQRKNISEMMFSEAKKKTSDVKMFVMEDFGERSDDGNNSLVFPKEIGDEMKNCDVSIYCAGSKKGELVSFRTPMLKIVENSKTLRHAHMPGVNDEIMETGMLTDYVEIKNLCKRVYDSVCDAKQIRVTTELGTDFTVNLGYKWIICDGDISKTGVWTNLPDGEVFTCQKNLNGRIVVDGVLGDYLDKKYGSIEKTPLTLEVKNGEIVNVECENKSIVDDINIEMKKDEFANRIGEFAIGTNIGLKELIGNMLQDEKFPGVHVAIGHGYPEMTGVEWNSSTHVDCVIRNTTIYVDGKKIMDKSKFLI